MPPPYDIFVSYATPDRPWAEHFYLDMKRAFPSLRVFWDRESLAPGSAYDIALAAALKDSTHLFNLVSNAATQSVNVAEEVAKFQVDVERMPTVDDSKRRQFSLVLQGAPPVSQIRLQSFLDMMEYYRPEPEISDRGVGALEVESAATKWNRIIRMTGDEVFASRFSHEITVAIVTLNQGILPAVEAFELGGIYAEDPNFLSLEQLLAQYNLTWAEVRTRYGDTGLDWKPFGGAKTILDLIEDSRVRLNARLGERDRFHWKPLDVSWRPPGPANQVSPLLERLHETTSIVILDPLALYERWANLAFRTLSRYTQEEQSVVLSLSPVTQQDGDGLARALRERTKPMFDDYFDPRIDTPRGFAHCALDVRRIPEVERLILNRLGAEHRNREHAALKPQIAMVTQ